MAYKRTLGCAHGSVLLLLILGISGNIGTFAESDMNDDYEEPRGAPMVNMECASAYDLLSQDPSFAIFRRAVDATGLQSILDKNRLVGTVFMPNDQAFIRAFEDGSQNSSAEVILSDLMKVYSVVRNHIVPSQYLTSSQVINGDCYPTMIPGECITVHRSLAGEVTLQSSGISGEVKLQTADMNMGCPTLFHSIDKILLPVQ